MNKNLGGDVRSKYLMVLFLLSFVVACNFSPSNTVATLTANAGLVQTIVAGTLTAFPTKTPIPTLTPTVTLTPTPNTTWVDHKIELSGALISIPPDWSLEEVNRRPEPNDIYSAPPKGHDCADYELKSSDGLTIVHLSDSCGFIEGYPDDFPPDGVIINPDAEEGRIARFSYEQIYYYSYVCVFGEGLTSSVYHAGQDVLCGSIPIAFGDTGMFISFTYMGGLDQVDKVFSIVDRIVLSIQK
jgi:hypothetical protein